ncbi:MAG: family 43 glycosylhydrolase [Bacteroidales bacterium]
MKTINYNLLGMLLLGMISCSKETNEVSHEKIFSNISKKDAPAVFTNPIPSDGGNYQDPWVVYAGGYYYYVHSDGGQIFVYKSSILQNVLLGTKVSIFLPSAGQPYSYNIWAPEMHYLNGRWYVYFAADDGNNENHRMFVLEGGTDANDPLNGQFVFKAQLAPTTDRWAIDGTPFYFNGQLYFVWSGWPGTTNVTQRLYIAKMSNPYTITGDRVEISAPIYSWEQVGASPSVNEGPQVLISGNVVHIIYSASGSWTDYYCLGRITCTDSNLMNPASWVKNSTSVFANFDQVYAPGHACFVKSPDGLQWWIVYHANKYKGSTWQRNIRIQQFTWENNYPYFGYPVNPGIPLASPTNGNAMVIANGTYRVINKVTGQCLDVPSGMNTPGLKIQQWPDNGNIAQKWTFAYMGDGYYKIIAACNGLSLDNPGGSYYAGAIIQQWHDNGLLPQRWIIYSIGDGYYRIINGKSLMALNVPYSNTTPGTKIEQWYQNQYDAELWQIIP